MEVNLNTTYSAQQSKSIAYIDKSIIKRTGVLAAVIWTVLIFSAVGWQLVDGYKNTLESIRLQALGSLEKDLLYRSWVAEHGGVYVVPTEETPPNPYLSDIKNRDLITQSGMELTLVNPAYMTRQVHELGQKQDGLQGHITSLTPLRPENVPDAWEKEALQGFERGEMEAFELTTIGGKDFARLMRPMIAETACLKCHAKQGYEEGDIRGGISISVPMAKQFPLIYRHMGTMTTMYIVVWLLGLGGIWFSSVRTERYIRERIQSIKALKDSEEKLNLIINTSSLGICTVDPFGNFVTTNLAYEQMLGYSKEEFKKLSFFDVTHPDYFPKNNELFQNMFASNSTGFKIEKVNVHKDGRLINVSVSATPVIDDEGNTKFGTVFVDDITEQKQVEEALAESAYLLTEAQRLTLIGSWVRDESSGRLMWSDETFKIFEIDKSFSGDLFERFLAAVHPDDRKFTADAYVNALKTKKPYTVTHRLLMPDGRVKHVIECCETTYDDSGNPMKSLGTVQDITERKKAENEQEKLMAQLIQAQKMESVGRLAGGIAHDYNNISSIIIGYSELALENVEHGDPLHDDLKEILTAAKRSTEITQQLLAFARQQTIEPKILDLNDTISNMLKMLRRLIGEDIDLAWLPGVELWPIEMDPSQIDQIMANLCVNARDAIADVGKMTVETKNISFDENYCSDHRGFSPGEYVLLAVSDDGSGIAPEILEKIFEPFFTSKSLGEGTGLGLATVYGIVKQNKGFINVYSEQGKGTTIKVYLSRHSGQTDVIKHQEISEIPLSCGETILLVEDEGSILKLGKRILGELGYTVLAATSPSEAVSLAKEYAGEIDLLITDVVMPEMNGHELSKLLQKAYLNLKVIFMSGYTANIIAHRGVLDDNVNFIPKPFSKEDMAVNVREVLDGVKDKTYT